MRIALLFIALAPIRICSFNNGWDEPPWWETGAWEQDWDGEIVISSPERNDVLCVGETIPVAGFVEFSNAVPQTGFAVFAVEGRVLCEGNPTNQGLFECEYTVQGRDAPDLQIDFLVEHPNGGQLQDLIRVAVEECDEQDTEVDTDSDTAAPVSMAVTSPQPSSVWAPSDPIPFVASVRQGDPVDDARVVWEVDGVQVPELTGRTNAQGTVVTVASFEVGPHEAVATVVVDGVLASQSTRFLVRDEDADTEPDSDSEADSDSE